MNSEIPANIFRQKSKKTHDRSSEIFYSYLIHLKKFFHVTKFLWQKKFYFEGPAVQTYAEGLETFLSKSEKKLEKNNDENFFSPKVLGARGWKGFQPI